MKDYQDKQNSQNTPVYSAFGFETKEDIVKKHVSTIDKFKVINRTVASTAFNLDGTTSIRAPFDKLDYERFRLNEHIPYDFKDVVRACRSSYLKFGVVRNVIDMMTDFVTEGMRFIHPDKKTEAFIKIWSQKINLRDAVCEFARHALIDANLVVKRTYAKLTQPVENEWMNNTSKATTVEKLYTENKTNKREIPWKYSFLNVAALEWKTPENQVSGEKELIFRLSRHLVNKLQKNPFDRNTIDKMPNISDIIISKEGGYAKIDLSKVYIAHSKKDSWEDWAPPFLYAILTDLSFKEKLKQMDRCAADGVINTIRLWKLGDHKEGILPNDAAFQKLASVLENSTGGGTIDIIWDSLIACDQIAPPIKEILGAEKYTQVDKDILIGLGVPEVLIGGKGANFSNSYIQLKTMVERLNHIRSMVVDWLNKEIRILCEAMDIEIPPIVRFNFMALEDENSTKKLIVGLLDRGVVSVEAVLQAYGEDYLTEINRMTEEDKLFKKVGIEVKSPFDQPEPTPGTTGRPPASKDTTTRKTRTPKVRKAELFVQGMKIIDKIEEYVLPVYLEMNKIKNARQMTSVHKDEFNLIKLGVLSQFNETTEVTEASINNKINFVDVKQINNLRIIIKNMSNQFDEIDAETLKRIEASAWVESIMEK